MEIKKWLKGNSLIITSIGGILLILNQTGFNMNIMQFYNSLNIESKILFIGLLNFIITVMAFVYVLNIKTKDKKSRNKRKE